MKYTKEIISLLKTGAPMMTFGIMLEHYLSALDEIEHLQNQYADALACNARLVDKVDRLQSENEWIPEGYDAIKIANFWMKVKKTDYCWEWQGSKNRTGYGLVHGAMAHQISYRIFYGKIPEGLEIMHSCNNPSCVNPAHLSAGSHTDNMQTMFKLRRYSRCGKSSKYIGVSYRNDSKKWRAVICHMSLGNYSTEEDAARVYDEAARLHYGKDAAVNFPLPTPPEAEC